MKALEEYTNCKKVLNFEDIKGKTIKHVVYDECVELVIIFTDNTYIVVSANGEDANLYLDDEISVYDLFTYNNFNIELSKLGKVVNADIEKIREDKHIETTHYEELAKERRYKQYLGLKKEFENSDN